MIKAFNTRCQQSCCCAGGLCVCARERERDREHVWKHRLWGEEPWCNAKLSWSNAKAHLPGCYQELNYSIKLLPLRLSPALSSLPLLFPFLPLLRALSPLLKLYPSDVTHASLSFSASISCCSFPTFLHLLVWQKCLLVLLCSCHHCGKKPSKCVSIVPDMYCAAANNKKVHLLSLLCI